MVLSIYIYSYIVLYGFIWFLEFIFRQGRGPAKKRTTRGVIAYLVIT